MFTLSGIFLEDGENLFRDFWSQFIIFFSYFFCTSELFKKNQPTPGRTRPGHLGPAFLSRDPRAPDSPAAPRPSQTLARAAAASRRPRHAAVVASRHRRRPPPASRSRRSPPPPRRNSAGLEVAAAGFSFKTVRFFYKP